jgi:hypothetical protein
MTIILGWTVIVNLLTLLGLKKIEFMGMSQSLPHLKKTSIIRNYKEDKDSEFQLYNSNNEHSDNFGASPHLEKPYLSSYNDRIKDNGGVEKWIDEF